MKARWILVLSFMVPGAIIAEESGDFRADLAKSLSSWLCEDPEYVACLGLTAAECSGIVDESLTACDVESMAGFLEADDVEFPSPELDEFGRCLSEKFHATIGLDKTDVCEPPDYPGPNKSQQEDAG